MVDIENFQQVNSLVAQDRSIEQALAAINAGARIVSMTLSGLNTVPANAAFFVDTQYMDYPPQMITSIKEAMLRRRQQIGDELTSLGVTGQLSRQHR